MKILIEKSIFMALVKEQIRQIITENNFTNVTDVYAYLSEEPERVYEYIKNDFPQK